MTISALSVEAPAYEYKYSDPESKGACSSADEKFSASKIEEHFHGIYGEEFKNLPKGNIYRKTYEKIHWKHPDWPIEKIGKKVEQVVLASIQSAIPLLTPQEWEYAGFRNIHNNLESFSFTQMAQIAELITTERSQILIDFFSHIAAQNESANDFSQKLEGTPTENAAAIRKWMQENTAVLSTIDDLPKIGSLRIPKEILLLPNINIQRIESALVSGAMDGRIELVNAIIESDRFNQIHPYHLGSALMHATIECANAIIQSNRFKEIDPAALNLAFYFAADHTDSKRLEAIIQSKRFKEIPSDTLGEVLVSTTKQGRIQCANAIIRSNRCNEIMQKDLAEAFSQAAIQGQIGFAYAILNSNRRHKIPILSSLYSAAKERVLDFTDRYAFIKHAIEDFATDLVTRSTFFLNDVASDF